MVARMSIQAETEEALYSHKAVRVMCRHRCARRDMGRTGFCRRSAQARYEREAVEEPDLALSPTQIAKLPKCQRTLVLCEDPLPLSGAGKILKTELRKPYWAGKDRQVA